MVQFEVCWPVRSASTGRAPQQLTKLPFKYLDKRSCPRSDTLVNVQREPILSMHEAFSIPTIIHVIYEYGGVHIFQEANKSIVGNISTRPWALFLNYTHRALYIYIYSQVCWLGEVFGVWKYSASDSTERWLWDLMQGHVQEEQYQYPSSFIGEMPFYRSAGDFWAMSFPMENYIINDIAQKY